MPRTPEVEHLNYFVIFELLFIILGSPPSFQFCLFHGYLCANWTASLLPLGRISRVLLQDILSILVYDTCHT